MRTDGWTPSADEQSDQHARLGKWLRAAREARGLTLDGVTRETRIPRRHLEAIERGNLDILPEFYQRAEIRAIARAIGVDEQQAVAGLQSASTPAQAPQPPCEPAEAAPPNPFVYGALALVAVAIVVAAFAGGAEPGPAAVTAPAQVTPGESSAPVAAAVDTESPNAALLQPAAAPPAPRPDAVTELVITTEPSGARVTVNGVGWGTSPIAIKHLPAGDKRIRVTKDGYSTAERVLALDEGGRRTVAIQLTSTQ